MMSEEMSERTTDIAELTAMNEESKQAIFKTQMRNISERMADGCPIRWRNCGGQSKLWQSFLKAWGNDGGIVGKPVKKSSHEPDTRAHDLT